MAGFLNEIGRLGDETFSLGLDDTTMAEMLEASPCNKDDRIEAGCFPLDHRRKRVTVRFVWSSRSLSTAQAKWLIRSFGGVKPGSMEHLLVFELAQDAAGTPLPRHRIAAIGASLQAMWSQSDKFPYIEQREYRRDLGLHEARDPWPPWTRFLVIDIGGN